MIIDCICGQKKFEVDDSQIPTEGRQVKCGVCSKEWFYQPEGSSEVQSQPMSIKEPVEENIPAAAESMISDAESANKSRTIFDDEDQDMPSRSEMDENLEKLRAERNKSKNQSNPAQRTRFLFYLLIVLLLVLGIVSVPFKSQVLAIFPELGFFFAGVEPIFNAIFK